MEARVNAVRLLPLASADGPHNMAADETLLEAAAAGGAALRFYGWSEPTLSLGYFQPQSIRLCDPLLSRLPWVRRPTGGAALVHHHEMTYALALPPGPTWQPRGESWLVRMHAVIAEALAPLAAAAESVVEESKYGEILCFLHHTPGDLRIGRAKLAGSAQRRQRGALLQHGAVLLAASPFTPALPGVADLAGRRPTVEAAGGGGRGLLRSPHRLGAGTVRLDGRGAAAHRRAGGREVRPSPLERTALKRENPAALGLRCGVEGWAPSSRFGGSSSSRERRAGRSSPAARRLSLPASRPPRRTRSSRRRKP